MAKQEVEEPEVEDGEGEESQAGMSGMMKILIIVGVVLVLEVIIIGAAVYMFTGNSGNDVEVENLNPNLHNQDVLAIDDFFYNFQEGPNVNRRYHAEIYIVIEVEEPNSDATKTEIETFKVEVEAKKG